MKRFRFTLIAVCLVLMLLGGHDLYLWLNNPEPQEISLAELEKDGPPRQWLTVTGGILDLHEAISTSGSIELEAFLVPLKTSPEQKQVRVLVETRDPQVMDLLRKFHFELDSEAARADFLAQRGAEFTLHRPVTGMLVGGLIASANSDKLLDLAKQLDLPVADKVICLSEKKTPPRWQGLFFFAVGLLGLFRVLSGLRRGAGTP